jgi:hypothetical protein
MEGRVTTEKKKTGPKLRQPSKITEKALRVQTRALEAAQSALDLARQRLEDLIFVAIEKEGESATEIGKLIEKQRTYVYRMANESRKRRSMRKGRKTK